MKNTILTLSTALLACSAHAATIVDDHFTGAGLVTNQDTNEGDGLTRTADFTNSGGTGSGFVGVVNDNGTGGVVDIRNNEGASNVHFDMRGGSSFKSSGALYSKDAVSLNASITSTTFVLTTSSVVGTDNLGDALADNGLIAGFTTINMAYEPTGLNAAATFGFKVYEGGVAFSDGSGFSNLTVTTGTFALADIANGFTTSLTINNTANTYSYLLDTGGATYSATDVAFSNIYNNNDIYAAFSLQKDSGSATNVEAFFDRALVTTTVVPEPSSTALLGLGGLALILRRRR